ncbi:hypothetical protein SCHPADRAFT_902536 [Schizopora paradoxa]|uniref:Uncharacterized protein n=1 Tax=Schizopora paradoxa TaxID=27342 RepID=A0A0H2RTR9_9AGAM|nr:hypothetical protein SCHPADRAFT_902536 [Schizopora paradoxa]
MVWKVFAALACVAAFARAQTISTTDQFGQTVVEVITVNPLAGATTTSIVSTIPAASKSSTATSTAPATIPNVQQGPVGVPGPTLPNQPTVYRYTTTDAAGDTLVLTDTFTVSFPPASTPSQTLTGSIIPFSVWQSLVGTNTVPVSNAALEKWRIPSTSLYIGGMLAAGLIGGAWVVLV